MQNWFDVITPHEDIRKGHFDEAVFAAKLGDVTSGEAPPDYNDPYAFYKKTYITSGLENLLQRVSEKLTDGKGPGVVQLQTPFGGGKTHALILTYHYLTSGERVEGLLPDGVEQQSPRLATIVGTDANASEGFETEGIQRRTLWGELAYQLGGEAALSEVQANDQNRTSPGRQSLRDVLEPLQPFCILLDEALEYVVRARGVEVGDTTLGAQTLSFFQELTEAVSSLPRGLMIATLPSGENEDFSDDKARNLGKIQQIFGRLEAIYTPVQGEEVYSIIRRRLFEAPDDRDDVREIIDQYVQRYGQHKDELPAKVREGDYRRKMERAYPFHPEVIDILYEKWGTFASFQRTRGALRLLAHVVSDLYEREANIDLILPGDVSLERPAVRREFLRHIGETYEGVIGSDIAGSSAKSQVLDRANREWKHLAERNATGVFLHSFSADSTQRGITLPHIKLGVMRQDTIPSLVFEVLSKQAGELWYLNQKGDRYYFSDVPNLNRMVIDKKGMVQPRAVRDELETLLKREFGNKLRCYLWPSSSDEIPDDRHLKLAVLDPENRPSERELKQWVDRRNGGFRAYQNTLFFALPDRDRFSRVAEDLKEFLALQEIRAEIENDDRAGMSEKRSEVNRRLKKLREDFPLRMRELYRTAAVPGAGGTLEMIDLGQPAVGRENLDSWYYSELSDQTRGKILSNAPSDRLLKAKFLSNGDTVPLSAVQEQFYKDAGLPALASIDLLSEAIADGVRSGSFGMARSEEGELEPSSLRFEENISFQNVQYGEGGMLISEEQARLLREKQKEEVEKGSSEEEAKETDTIVPGSNGEGPGAGGSGDGETSTITGSDEDTPKAQTVRRFHVRASGLSSNDLFDLSQGVFSPLAREVGDVTFTIEVDVSSDEGISEKVIEQQVMETLQQLGAVVEKREQE